MNRRKTRSSLAVLTVLGMVVALLPLTALPAAAAGITETFDDSSKFTSSEGFFSDGGFDYLGITDGVTGDFGAGTLPTGLKPYTGFDGNFLAGMDLDGEGAALPITFEWTGIDIVGMTSIEFSGDFAEFFDVPGDIDEPDFLLVEYQIDGGGYQNLLSFVGADFTSTSGPFNGFFKEDTDFDGVGDGATLGDAAQTFTKAVTGTGSTLDLRLTVSVDAGDEDFAVDNFSIAEAGAPPAPELVINEIMQNPSAVADADGEWFELYNPTASDVDLLGWMVRDDGTDSFAITTSVVVPAGGYAVLGNNANLATNGGVAVDYEFSGMFIGNGGDEIVLLDTGLAEVDRVNYDGGPLFPDPTGAAMALKDPTLDNNDGTNWCTASTPYGAGDLGTPGAANDCPVVEPPADVDTLIYDIQFTTDPEGDSPLVGTEVVTEGVATAVFGGLVFIQDGTGPFSGLALFNPSIIPAIGDLVRVRGTVTEFFGLTQIANGTSWIMGSGSLPAPEVLATGAIGEEQWESVFVRAENATVVNASLGFGEWSIDDGTGAVRVDDRGSYTYVPVTGDPVGFLQGPLDYSFSNFKIQPRDDGDIYAGLAVCGADFTPIYDIQGNGFSSPLDGSTVWTEGVVTADFQMESQLSAFYIQDAAGDGDPLTSDGVMVYHRDVWGYDVSVGDSVRLRATVDEYFGLTELTNVETLSLCGTGSVAPAVAQLPLDDAEREALEGMYVTFPQSLNIIEFFNFDRFGEYVLGNGRQFQPTQVFEPGSLDAEALAAANEMNQLRVDDARGGQNEDPAIHPNGLPFTLDNRFRGGDLVTNLTGVVDYAFGDYKVQPTQGADYMAINPRTNAPVFDGATVRVAAFNVLNLFTHFDDGTNDICGPLGIDECRGADTDRRFTDPEFVYESEEYPRQRDKIVAGIIGLDADVVGLMEIENDIRDDEPVYPNQAHDPVIKLVEALNAAEAAAGSGYTWDWDIADYYNNYPVRNEIIYRSTVTPFGPPVALQDLAFDGVRPEPDGNLGHEPVGRPPVAQTFIDPNGELVTVVANHFKSKGSGCEDGVFNPSNGELLWVDPASENGQANCPLTRVKQAEALMSWLATDPTGAGDPDVLIIGDLNAYAMEDPIDVIETAGYTNLLKYFNDEFAYTYVFDGQLGNLDHALGSPAIMSQVVDTAAWNINSDEPDILDYDTTFKQDAQDALYEPNAYRASDHDPVIVGLRLDTVAPQLEVSLDPDRLWPPNHKYRTVEATVTASDNLGIVYWELISVTSNEMDCCYDESDLPNDILIVDETTFELRAERYLKPGRTYTVTYRAWDPAGNETFTSATVFVPHDQRDRKLQD